MNSVAQICSVECAVSFGIPLDIKRLSRKLGQFVPSPDGRSLVREFVEPKGKAIIFKSGHAKLIGHSSMESAWRNAKKLDNIFRFYKLTTAIEQFRITKIVGKLKLDGTIPFEKCICNHELRQRVEFRPKKDIVTIRLTKGVAHCTSSGSVKIHEVRTPSELDEAYVELKYLLRDVMIKQK